MSNLSERIAMINAQQRLSMPPRKKKVVEEVKKVSLEMTVDEKIAALEKTVSNLEKEVKKLKKEVEKKS